MTPLVTRELSEATWPDFAWFFSQGNGWDHCACVSYQGVRPPREARTWADQRDSNLAVKCALVAEGRAHGILVYAGDTPIGWCQFGPETELPLLERRKARATTAPWRITCFCTDKEWRQQGVAETALRAALASIRSCGGGVVEAWPVATMPRDDRLDELVKAHGGESTEVREHLLRRSGATDVRYYDGRPYSLEGVVLNGAGPMTVLVRRMAGALHPGTMAMFEGAGFEARSVRPPASRVRPYSRVVMQLDVLP